MEMQLCAAEMSGYLKKRSVQGRDQERWFELRNQRLYFYKAKPMVPSIIPLGEISLREASVVRDAEDKTAFQVSIPMMHKQYSLSAKNEGEAVEWLAKIKESRPEDDEQSCATGSLSSDDDALSFSQAQQVSLDDFTIKTVIGEGAFGQVVKAAWKSEATDVALKCMSKDLILADGLEAHVMFERNTLASVNHPFIATLHAAFQTKTHLFLAMEYLSGGDLYFQLDKHGSFSEEVAKFYAAQIGTALDHLHGLGIIYRDLKPENCVLDKDGNCCLIDFGLAKQNAGKETGQLLCGTPEYLAPEFLGDKGHGKAVDWWALGIVLYEMITGGMPFDSNCSVNDMYEQILHKKVQFPKEMTSDAKDACRKLLERCPEKRVQSMAALQELPFFAEVDFELLGAKRIDPPLRPDSTTLNFSSAYTSVPVDCLTESSSSARRKTHAFDGFHYEPSVTPLGSPCSRPSKEVQRTAA